MSRVTDGWNGKIEEFEKINAGLQSSLSQLRDENELLRLKVGANIFCLISSNIFCLVIIQNIFQVEQKSIELEGTRARLRQLERTSDNPGGVKKTGIMSNSKQQQQQQQQHETESGQGQKTQELGSRLGHDNYVKFSGAEQRSSAGEQRVTFDLASNTVKKTKIVEVAPAKMNTAAVVDIASKTRSQLPSDAKQRLQEMAGYDVKRNYRKSSSGSIGEHPSRPNRLNLNGVGGKYVSPPSSPVKLQPPDLTNHKLGSESRDQLLTNHKLQTPDLTNHRPARTSSSLSRNNSRNSGLNSAKSSLMQSTTNQNIINNNNIRAKTRDRDSLSRHVVSNPPANVPTNLAQQQRTRTPSVERSLPSIKESADSSSKVRGRSFWGGWWKF